MKKLVFGLLSLLVFGSVSAYSPTRADELLLNAIYPSFEKVVETDSVKGENYVIQLKKMERIFLTQNPRFSYIFGSIADHIEVLVEEITSNDGDIEEIDLNENEEVADPIEETEEQEIFLSPIEIANQKLENMQNMLLQIEISLNQGNLTMEEIRVVGEATYELKQYVTSNLDFNEKSLYFYEVEQSFAKMNLYKADLSIGNFELVIEYINRAIDSLEKSMEFATDSKKTDVQSVIEQLEETIINLEYQRQIEKDIDAIEGGDGLLLRSDACPMISREYYLKEGFYNISGPFPSEDYHVVKIYDENNSYDLIINSFERTEDEVFQLRATGMYYFMAEEACEGPWTLRIIKIK